MEAAEDDQTERGNRRETHLKGTVRPLADSISVEQAERAAKQVQEAIAQQQRQLDELQRFSVENKLLSQLVLELPDSVSHQIMVPFGKAAFFPGRLKHTNEFLVLLGENHYAERSAKQTAEILQRRSNFLDQKISSTKAQIADLEAESSFMTSTAEEAKAGLVEIREEYVGSGQLRLNKSSSLTTTGAAASRETNPLSQVGNGSDFEASTSSTGSGNVDEDHEHDLLMARLSELELAEAAADEDEDEDEDNEDSEEEVDDGTSAGVFEPSRSDIRRREVSRNENDLVEEGYDSEETEDEDSHSENDDGYVRDTKRNFEEEIKPEDDDEDDYHTQRHGEKQKQKQEAQMGKPLSRFAREAYAKKGAFDSQHALQRAKFEHGSPTGKKPQSIAGHEIHNRALQKPEALQGSNDFLKELHDWRSEGAQPKGSHAGEGKSVGSSSNDRNNVPSTDVVAAGQLKAFTGKVTERSSPEPAIPNQQQPKVEAAAQQSRPISKFKMRQAQAGRR